MAKQSAGRGPSITWIYSNRRWLAACGAVFVVGTLAGIFVEGGRFMPLVGSAVGAMLGTIGGIFGGLVVQEQRRRDEMSPDVVRLINESKPVLYWVDLLDSDACKDPAMEALALNCIRRELNDKDIFTRALKLGPTVDRLLKQAREEIENWNRNYDRYLANQDHTNTAKYGRLGAVRLGAVIRPLLTRLEIRRFDD